MVDRFFSNEFNTIKKECFLRVGMAIFNFADDLIEEFFLRDWGDRYLCYYIVYVPDTDLKEKECVRERHFKQCESVGLFTEKEACEEAMRKGFTHDGNPWVGEYLENSARKKIEAELQEIDDEIIEGKDDYWEGV